jgi:hypothetical protein
MRMRLALALSLVALVAAPVAQAETTPAQKCAAAKLRAATHKVNAELRCQKKALNKAVPVDPECLAKAQAKFEAAFAKAEAKGGCKTEGDAAAVQESAELFVDDVVTTLGPPKSLATDVQPIFSANCTGCHGNPGPANLTLTPGDAFGEIVGIDSFQVPEVKRVLPGDPDNSYLYWKITDNPGIGATNPMPYGAYPMTQREIRMIRRWIEQGALDN